MELVYCNDSRECFAKLKGKCTVLNTNYEDGKCPFRKEKNEVDVGLAIWAYEVRNENHK